MQTFELLIVLAALMAMISVVAIAIDWVGKPLRSRRFVARVYRFDDEMVTIAPDVPIPAPQPSLQRAYPAAPPLGQAVQPTIAVPLTDAEHRPPATAAAGITKVAATASGAEHASSSTWQDLVAEPQPDRPASQIAGRESQAPPPATEWNPGMPLDQHVAGRRPSPTVKAERFWKSTAHVKDISHFDTADLDRMASGKPPRRRNPRTQKYESLQLAGLREASNETEVRMYWNDDALDPWDAR